MSGRSLFLCCMLLLRPFAACAQDINGDTIRVYAQTATTITFPKEAEIQNVHLTNKAAYSLQVAANKLIIEPGEHPDICGLALTEEKIKTQKILRQHYFILVYINTKCSNPADLYHDLSSRDKIAARIQHLKDAGQERMSQPPVPAASVAPVATGKNIAAAAAGSDVHADMERKNASVTVPVQEDTSSIDLGNGTIISKEAFKSKAEKKTKELSTFLVYLCDKRNNADDCREAVRRAMTLFINEDVLVEISSKKTGKRRHEKIQTYLDGMSIMRYSKVELSWSNIQFVGKLEKQPDGTYRGFVEFEQRFSGFIDGRLVYSDRTNKKMEVVLKTTKVMKDGDERIQWDVLLSDIGVESTS